MKNFEYSITVIFGKDAVNKYNRGDAFSELEKLVNSKQYYFETEMELNAFIKGIEETVGWLDVHYILENMLEMNSKDSVLTT